MYLLQESECHKVMHRDIIVYMQKEQESIKVEHLTTQFHDELEKDIKNLSKEVKKLMPSETPEKAVRNVLQKRISEEKRKLAKEIPPLPSYISLSPPEVRLEIEQLIDKAWHKGVSAVLTEARKSGALIFDAFHDALSSKVYDEFKKRGLLKPKPNLWLAISMGFILIVAIIIAIVLF